MGEWRYNSMLSQAWQQTEMNGQLHALTVVSLEERAPGTWQRATSCCYACGMRRLGTIKFAKLNFFTFDHLPYLSLSLSLSLTHTHTHTYTQSAMCSAPNLQQNMKTMFSSSSLCKMLFLEFIVEMSTRPSTRDNFLKCSVSILKKGAIAYYSFP